VLYNLFIIGVMLSV